MTWTGFSAPTGKPTITASVMLATVQVTHPTEYSSGTMFVSHTHSPACRPSPTGTPTRTGKFTDPYNPNTPFLTLPRVRRIGFSHGVSRAPHGDGRRAIRERKRRYPCKARALV